MVATQCSTNSLLGAPAFVAFAAPGVLLWLQFDQRCVGHLRPRGQLAVVNVAGCLAAIALGYAVSLNCSSPGPERLDGTTVRSIGSCAAITADAAHRRRWIVVLVAHAFAVFGFLCIVTTPARGQAD